MGAASAGIIAAGGLILILGGMRLELWFMLYHLIICSESCGCVDRGLD